MKKSLLVLSVVAAFAAHADMMSRPDGVRVGKRLTIRPYVSLFYTWDSNVRSLHEGDDASSLNINPGLTLAYRAENWSIMGGAYYQYHAYTKNADDLNQNSWGENLAFNWTNSKGGGPGWSLVLRESYEQISQDDDMTSAGGRGVGRDRDQLEFAATLQRRFTERWHGDINATYYMIDYDNDAKAYAPLYGWTRWTVGAQAGFVASKWTDIVLMGTYQGYTQSNDTDLGGEYGPQEGRNIANNSQGYTVHIGFGTYATEKISYRLSGGYSGMDYAESVKLGGFTYSASGHWRMSDTWNMMLLAASYYHPSETEYGSATRTDTISWGLGHSMIRNKLSATLDLTYRRDDRQYTDYVTSQAVDDILTARLGLNYTLNRYLSIFGNAEYQKSLTDGDPNGRYARNCDYDRWRLTVGLRLTY